MESPSLRYLFQNSVLDHYLVAQQMCYTLLFYIIIAFILAVRYCAVCRLCVSPCIDVTMCRPICVCIPFIFPVFTARCTLVQSAVLRSHVVCPSVCPSVRLSVTLVDCDHIGWNASKIISPLVSLGRSLFATPT